MGLWKQPLPDVRKFLTFCCTYAEVANITAHGHHSTGEKFLLPELPPKSVCFGIFFQMAHAQLAQLGFTFNLELIGEHIN